MCVCVHWEGRGLPETGVCVCVGGERTARDRCVCVCVGGERTARDIIVCIPIGTKCVCGCVCGRGEDC